MQTAPYLPTEMENFYVSEFTRDCRDNLAGPLKWYRTMKPDWEDAKAIADNGGTFFIDKPTMFICGKNDQFVPCAISQGMEQFFSDFTKHELDSGHWLQIEKADTVNELFQEWLGQKF